MFSVLFPGHVALLRVRSRLLQKEGSVRVSSKDAHLEMIGNTGASCGLRSHVDRHFLERQTNSYREAQYQVRMKLKNRNMLI